MELHPLAAQFDSVAESYDFGRPEYAPAVAGAIAGELGLVPGDPVLDLGSGTGKLARALLALGLDVVAVEPQPSLRAVLSERIGAERVRDGVAEALPLADGSLAAVTVADAFHWFDRPRALAEIRRVLRADGGLALLNTVPDWAGASWAHELGKLVVGSRPEHPNFDGRPWREFVEEAPGWGEPWEVSVTTHPLAEPERILAHLGSISWVAGMDDESRADLLGRMRALIQDGHTPERMPLHVQIGLTRVV